MPANFARLLWANYTSSWSKSLAIDKIDSHTVVSLTILGRTDRGRERERERQEPGRKKGEGKRKKKGGETGRGGEGALYFESMCACIYALGFRPKGQCTTEIRLC